MMVGTWLLISHSVATRFTFWATIGTGTGLVFGAGYVPAEPTDSGSTALVYCDCPDHRVLGVAAKAKKCLWVVFAMTILALSSKLRLELNPVAALGPYHILVAASTFCLGKAIEAEYRILFK